MLMSFQELLVAVVVLGLLGGSMLSSFLVTKGADSNSVLVVFRDPVESFVLDREKFLELLLDENKSSGGGVPLAPSSEIVGCAVYSCSKSAVDRFRKRVRAHRLE